MPASTMPISRDSPSSASPSTNGASPSVACGFGHRASAPSSAWRSGGIRCWAVLGLRRLVVVLLQARGDRRGGLDAVAGDDRARIGECASGSGTVGPEAITAGSSPGTSLIASVTTRAGRAAAASRPPLIAERCLRTQFISVMFAPDASSARLIACLSASVRPAAGAAHNADPPPDISASTRSSGPKPVHTLQQPARASFAVGVGHRMRGLDHLDVAASARRGRSG